MNPPSHLVAMLGLCLSSSVSVACLPLSPANVVVGRIEKISPQPTATVKNNAVIHFTDYHFVFRTWKQWWVLPSAKNFAGDLANTHFAPNDIVVALTDYQNGDKPHDYTIFTMAKLTCQRNRLRLQQQKTIPSYGWNRQQKRCGVVVQSHGILDGFVDNDQAYYMAKLQQKYPTCEALQKAFASL